ncbi:YitT family protein [Peribacillus sp. AS_2]|uniref:YitT family protein n=1 Tax=Peribacillus sp. AS_2 TaxID=2996755 RepID=UPI0035BBA4AA
MARKYQITYELSGITLGCFLFAFGTNCLLTPSSLLAGGLGGVCAIFYHLFEWPMGIQYFVYNIPLLFLGYIHVGKKFIIYTVFSVIVSSLFLDWIPVRLIWTKDILLCCIYGAIISGSGVSHYSSSGRVSGRARYTFPCYSEIHEFFYREIWINF